VDCENSKKICGGKNMINEKNEDVYFQSMRPEMVQFIPKEYSKVLEIGCNDGSFRQYIKNDCEYWGVEPFERAAKIAEPKMDKILTDFYENVKNEIPDNYFDLVVANDVIEHMMQPWDFLESIKEKMTANACLVLSVPNVRHFPHLKELLFEKDWKYKDMGILDITHLRFFTKKSIVCLLNEKGFEIEEIEGIRPCDKPRKMRKLKYYICKHWFGEDIIFQQFGIRVKKR
jgi:2-polyprenyl-3-methyl-5-hydroxy-6-metoxy-1,4-benzoquinol methylase